VLTCVQFNVVHFECYCPPGCDEVRPTSISEKFSASIFRVTEVAGFSDTKPHCVSLIISGILLWGVFFYPEDGEDAFLRNVDGFLPNYMALQPYRSYSSRFTNLYAMVRSVGRIFINDKNLCEQFRNRRNLFNPIIMAI
jgi:hypothetical protein